MRWGLFERRLVTMLCDKCTAPSAHRLSIWSKRLRTGRHAPFVERDASKRADNDVEDRLGCGEQGTVAGKRSVAF